MRRVIAGLITGLSLLVASFSWVGFGLLHTALDAGRSEHVADALLTDEAVRDQLEANVASAVSATVPGFDEVDRGQVELWAAEILESPALEALIRNALVQTHAAFLGEGEAPESLDLTSVIAGAHEAAVAAHPALAGALPPPADLVIDLPTDQVPDVGWLRRGLERYVLMGGLLAVGGIALALVITTDRPSILRRGGFWAVGAAALWLIVGYGLPWMVSRLFSGQAIIAGALIDSLAGGMTTPALWLAGAGLAGLVISVAWLGFDPSGREAPEAAPQPIAVILQPPASPGWQELRPPRPVQPSGPAPAPAPVTMASPAASPGPPPAPAPAPTWVEGVGYVTEDPAPRWVPGVGYVSGHDRGAPAG